MRRSVGAPAVATEKGCAFSSSSIVKKGRRLASKPYSSTEMTCGCRIDARVRNSTASARRSGATLPSGAAAVAVEGASVTRSELAITVSASETEVGSRAGASSETRLSATCCPVSRSRAR